MSLYRPKPYDDHQTEGSYTWTEYQILKKKVINLMLMNHLYGIGTRIQAMQIGNYII